MEVTSARSLMRTTKFFPDTGSAGAKGGGVLLSWTSPMGAPMAIWSTIARSSRKGAIRFTSV